MSKSDTETLTTTLREKEFDDCQDYIRRRIIGIQMLAGVQDNLIRDIQNILTEKGKYKYEVKMNLGQLHRYILMNIKNDSFFGRMPEDELNKYMAIYEPLEQIVYDYIDKAHPL